jgi:hypothetical protein
MANARDALVCRCCVAIRAVHNVSSQWDSGHDESVEVNQRALIDKVLARYSGEFTGELLNYHSVDAIV